MWVDEDLGLHWYKSKVNESHGENMILSKKNMELEKENINLQKKLMNFELIDKKETGVFMVRLMLYGIVLVCIFIWVIIM